MVSPTPIEAPAPAAAPFERILVPVDFSAASRAAFVAAIGIADRWGSQVVLFNAPGYDCNDGFLNATGVPWGLDDVLEETREHLRSFADTVAPGSATRVTVDVQQEDDPVRAIVNACARHASTLVVLGVHPHARRPLRRTRHERVVHEVSCAVLLVPGEAEPRPEELV
jgi:nucleotide-binding universal stress UspA family protein